MIRTSLLFAFISFVILWEQPSIAEMTNKRILVIHSYHREHVSMPKRNIGLQNVLNDIEDIDIKYFYMDTKRKSSLEWKHKVARMAHERISEFEPDLLILFDDNAQRYVAKNYMNADKPQIVFAGVNDEPEAYGYPASNVTGILERTYPDQTLLLLSKIDPKIKRVAFISDDSATADGVIQYIRANKMPLDITAFDQPKSFDEWKKTVTRHENDPMVDAFLIPLYHTIKTTEKKDSRVPPPEVMKWTIDNTKKPIGGLWPFATKDGALCAVTVDLTEHGMVAAEMALRILNGVNAGQIPIVKNKDGFVIINIQTARRLDTLIPYEILQIADKILE